MDRKQIVEIIEERKLVAVVRLDSTEDVLPVAEALFKGGISLIELTMTIPGVLDSIEPLRKEMGQDILVGLGSVLSADMTREVVQAGAQFVVSPIMKPEIIKAAHQGDVPAAIGAYSPTEIQIAWEEGADFVKVFPASQLGPSYIKAVRAPLPHLKLMPTGGVSSDNVHDWLAAGTFGLGVGGALVDQKAIREKNFEKLTESARILSDKVKSFKK